MANLTTRCFLQHCRRWNHCNTVKKLSSATNSGQHKTQQSHRFVIVGGGAGGLSIASFLARKFPDEVAVIEPSDKHYYQALWTLVGGGVKDVNESIKPMAAVMPDNTKWIQERAAMFDPSTNTVTTKEGTEVKYEFLVVATGLQLDFHKVKGLTEALGMEGVGCNYSVNTVTDTFKAIKNFKGGNALFTLPNTPIKCQGAPQKIMYLAEDYFRQNDLRSKVNVRFMTALSVMFAVPKYRQVLEKICKERDIDVNFRHNLIEINYARKEATFEILDQSSQTIGTKTFEFDMIHVTPPQGPIDALKGSAISDTAGFVDINQYTMQHKTYPNIFALGDCSNAPISKTAAAIAGQSSVLRRNLMNIVQGHDPGAKYNGYTSCPLITGYNKCILAEFNYDAVPMETFPFDQSKERRTMWHLKADVMPEIYWHGLIKGYWGGPKVFRKIFHLGMTE